MLFRGILPFHHIQLYETRETFWLCCRLLFDDSGLHQDDTNLWQIVSIPRHLKNGLEFHVETSERSISREEADLYFHEQKAVLSHPLIHAIFGFYKTSTGYVLVVVTKSEIVATVGNHEIFVVREHLLIPIAYKPRVTREETRYRNFVGLTDINHNVYFSYRYELHRSWQSLVLQRDCWSDAQSLGTDDEASRSSLRYCWNAYAMLPVLEAIKGLFDLGSMQDVKHASILAGLFVPFICGYVRQVILPLSIEPSSIVTTATTTASEGSDNISVEKVRENPSIETQTRDGGGTSLQLRYVLLSRRSTVFAGTRYLRRGMNTHGHVANEVETEQLLFLSSSDRPTPLSMTSYVQHRGSIPLYWHHVNIFSPMPNIDFDAPVATTTAATTDSAGVKDKSEENTENETIAHWRILEQRYGRCTHVMNLLRQATNHRERALHERYHDICRHLENESMYRWLDYHDFDLLNDGKAFLSLLVEKLTHIVFETGICSRNEPKESSSTLASSELPDLQCDIGIRGSNNGSCISTKQIESSTNLVEIPISFEDEPDLQHGILRTNCVDCLDRTNLGQFLAARVALSMQLETLEKNVQLFVISAEQLAHLQGQLLRLWTENGDRIAYQYAGSSAMHRMQEQQSTKSKATDTSSASAPNQPNRSDDKVDIESYVSADIPPTDSTSDKVASTAFDTKADGSSSILLVGELVPPEVEDDRSSFTLEKDTQQLVPPLSSSSTAEDSFATVDTIAIETSRVVADNQTVIAPSSLTSTTTPIVDTSQLSVVSNTASNAIISIQRYFQNISTDFERQYAFDFLLGNYERSVADPIWKKSPYTENNRIQAHTLASYEVIHLLQQLGKRFT